MVWFWGFNSIVALYVDPRGQALPGVDATHEPPIWTPKVCKIMASLAVLAILGRCFTYCLVSKSMHVWLFLEGSGHYLHILGVQEALRIPYLSRGKRLELGAAGAQKSAGLFLQSCCEVHNSHKGSSYSLIWYVLLGVEYMVYNIWYILLEVQGRYNRARTAVLNHV